MIRNDKYLPAFMMNAPPIALQLNKKDFHQKRKKDEMHSTKTECSDFCTHLTKFFC